MSITHEEIAKAQALLMEDELDELPEFSIPLKYAPAFLRLEGESEERIREHLESLDLSPARVKELMACEEP